MRTVTRKQVLLTLLLISLLFSTYTMTKNLVVDPNANEFLSHKDPNGYGITLPTWLSVMHIHVVSACVVLLAGVVNFSRLTYEAYPLLHRIIGIVYVIAMVITNCTSGYMAPAATGGKITSVAFNLANILWLVFTIGGIVHIMKNRPEQHRNWMIRSFVICLLNPVLHLIAFVLHNGMGIDFTIAYVIGVYGAIVFNLAAAELVIRRLGTKREPA